MKRYILGFMISLSSVVSIWANDLMTIYQDALYNDPIFREAEAAYLAAQQLTPIARAELLPALNATGNASYTWTHEGDTQNNAGKRLGYSVTLSQSIFNLTNWAGLSKAKAQVKEQDALYAAAVQNLLIRAASAYFEVLKARDILIYTESEKIALAEQLTNTIKRYQVGVDTLTRTYEAQATYDSAVAREINARATLAKSIEDLRRLTGRIYDKLALLDDLQLVPPEPADIELWTETAQMQNLDLIAAGFGVEAALAALREAQSGHAPTLSADATYNHALSRTGSNIDVRNTVGALTLSIPIFEGGKVTASSKRARQIYNQADATRESRLREAVNSVRKAYLDVVGQMSQVEADRQTIRSRENALQAKQKQYDVGTITLFEVLDAQKELYNAQREYAQNQYTYILSGLSLKQSAGILQVDDITGVNSMLGNTPIQIMPAPAAEPDNSSLNALNVALAELSYTDDERHLLSLVSEDAEPQWVIHFDVAQTSEVSKLVDELELDDDDLFYYRMTDSMGDRQYVAVYGVYKTERRAQRALGQLPKSLQALKPEIITLDEVQDDILAQSIK